MGKQAPTDVANDSSKKIGRREAISLMARAVGTSAVSAALTSTAVMKWQEYSDRKTAIKDIEGYFFSANPTSEAEAIEVLKYVDWAVQPEGYAAHKASMLPNRMKSFAEQNHYSNLLELAQGIINKETQDKGFSR